MGPICISNLIYKFRSQIGPNKQKFSMFTIVRRITLWMHFFWYLTINITKPCPGSCWDPDQSGTYVPKGYICTRLVPRIARTRCGNISCEVHKMEILYLFGTNLRPKFIYYIWDADWSQFRHNVLHTNYTVVILEYFGIRYIPLCVRVMSVIDNKFVLKRYT